MLNKTHIKLTILLLVGVSLLLTWANTLGLAYDPSPTYVAIAKLFLFPIGISFIGYALALLVNSIFHFKVNNNLVKIILISIVLIQIILYLLVVLNVIIPYYILIERYLYRFHGSLILLVNMFMLELAIEGNS